MGEKGEKRVFLREATGLVREMRWYDALFLNFLNMSIGLGAAWVIFWGPGIYPGANLPVGLLIAAIGCIFGMICFATLTASMPRSGGDYVFVSRCLHPSLGFASNWTWVVWNVVWCAVLGTWVVTWGLRDLFGMLGVVYNDATYLDWATKLSQPDHPVTFTISALVVTLSGVMLALGMRVYLKVQTVCVLVGLLMLIVAAAVFATTSPAEFEATWDAYAAEQGAMDYDTTVADADTVTPWYSDWGTARQTLGILPIGFWVLAYPYFSAFLGGELKRAKTTAFVGNLGGVIIGGLFIYVLWVLVAGTVGKEFIVGTYGQYYGYTDNAYLMPSQWYDFYAGIISGNSVVIYIMGIGMIGWLLMYPALSYLGQTRAALAWSFDRIIPGWFGKVSDRWHTPINAIIFFVIIDLIYLAIYAKTFAYQTSFSAMLGQVCGTFMFVGLSAIVLPFRKNTKAIYEASGVKMSFLRIPLVTIAGVIWVLFLFVNIYYFIIDPNLGASDYWSAIWTWKTSDEMWGFGFSLILTAVIFFAGFGLYWVARWYRKTQGINIDLAFKELPPE
jgi:amino acid transporter